MTWGCLYTCVESDPEAGRTMHVAAYRGDANIADALSRAFVAWLAAPRQARMRAPGAPDRRRHHRFGAGAGAMTTPIMITLARAGVKGSRR
jgi:hypothetical protein